MEGIAYLTQTKLSFADLMNCLNSGEYKAHLYNDSHFGERVIVYFEMVYDGRILETFCWWDYAYIEEQEQQQILIYKLKDPELKYVFDITFNPGTITGLFKVLERVISCYGGCIYFEGKFFDEYTIEMIRDMKLGQISEDE